MTDFDNGILIENSSYNAEEQNCTSLLVITPVGFSMHRIETCSDV